MTTKVWVVNYECENINCCLTHLVGIYSSTDKAKEGIVEFLDKATRPRYVYAPYEWEIDTTKG
jgi:hypothetical protein